MPIQPLFDHPILPGKETSLDLTIHFRIVDIRGSVQWFAPTGVDGDVECRGVKPSKVAGLSGLDACKDGKPTAHDVKDTGNRSWYSVVVL